jgi:hypothetical protein
MICSLRDHHIPPVVGMTRRAAPWCWARQDVCRNRRRRGSTGAHVGSVTDCPGFHDHPPTLVNVVTLASGSLGRGPPRNAFLACRTCILESIRVRGVVTLGPAQPRRCRWPDRDTEARMEVERILLRGPMIGAGQEEMLKTLHSMPRVPPCRSKPTPTAVAAPGASPASRSSAPTSMAAIAATRPIELAPSSPARGAASAAVAILITQPRSSGR